MNPRMGHNAIREKALVNPSNEDIRHNGSKELLSPEGMNYEKP